MIVDQPPPNYIQRKAKFISDALAQRQMQEASGDSSTKLTANELSVFYKQFLDEKYPVHMKYLR